MVHPSCPVKPCNSPGLLQLYSLVYYTWLHKSCLGPRLNVLQALKWEDIPWFSFCKSRTNPESLLPPSFGNNLQFETYLRWFHFISGNNSLNHFCFLFRWQRCKKSVMEEPVSWNAFAWWTASERNNFKACFPDQSSCLRLFFSAVIDALLNKAHYSAYTSALCICHLSYMWFQQFLFHRHECKGSPSLQSWPCVKENHGDL